MLRGIVAFGLTRRAIIVLGLLVFIAGGIIAFTKLNIEAYPNPAPVILEITAQAPGLCRLCELGRRQLQEHPSQLRCG